MPDDGSPSAGAASVAAGMRAFDAALSDADLAAIARGIDAQRELGALLSPKRNRLRNDVEPLTVVTAPDAGT